MRTVGAGRKRAGGGDCAEAGKFRADAGASDELALGATSAFDGVGTSGLQSGVAWRWARPSVAQIGGAYYLIDLGEVYSRSGFISLRRIHASGPLIEA